MAYKVDNLPWYWLLPVYIYAYTLACILYLVSLFVHTSSKIIVEGEEYISNTNQNFIFCAWHQFIPSYFAVFIKQDRPHVWMNHPHWTMKPIHIFLSFIGINEIVLGSSGNNGKQALQELSIKIKNGASTYIFPDGPAGPVKEIKQGIIDLAYETGVPIIPVQFVLKNYIQLNTWDKKKIPLPFSKIIVKYKAPIYVTDNNKNEVKLIIESALNNNNNG